MATTQSSQLKNLPNIHLTKGLFGTAPLRFLPAMLHQLLHHGVALPWSFWGKGSDPIPDTVVATRTRGSAASLLPWSGSVADFEAGRGLGAGREEEAPNGSPP